MEITSSALQTLATREDYRDRYGKEQDPINDDRLMWRAQSFRHMVHLLPGETILELGAGSGMFTHHLLKVSRGANPITAITFRSAPPPAFSEKTSRVEWITAASLPHSLGDRQFDHIIAMDLLDQRTCVPLLRDIHKLLRPGGQVLFYESNPWNVVLKLRRLVARAFGSKDPRRLLSRSKLYELMSEIGFTRVFAVYNDFVYAPLNGPTLWLLRNVSILLENMPAVNTLAGAILLHAQVPGRRSASPDVSLVEHDSLRNAVSIVIPCHNEEMNIRPLVSRLIALYGGYIHEIILVDDNSQDDTAQVIHAVAREYPVVKGIFRKPPNGVGRAILEGYRASTGAYVLSMDCDFTHLLPELRDLFDAAAEGYDAVIGSRFSRHSVLLNYPFQKIVANRGFHLLARILVHKKFRDLTNNLKLLRREVVQSLDLVEPHFAVNAETGLQPLLMGYAIKEVPISWINRTPDMGVSSFRLASVGGGYWRVLFRLALASTIGFRKLRRAQPETGEESIAAL